MRFFYGIVKSNIVGPWLENRFTKGGPEGAVSMIACETVPSIAIRTYRCSSPSFPFSSRLYVFADLDTTGIPFDLAIKPIRIRLRWDPVVPNGYHGFDKPYDTGSSFKMSNIGLDGSNVALPGRIS